MLCPTRWTVCADSLCSIIDNYVTLQDTWEEAADIVSDAPIPIFLSVSAQTTFYQMAS